jgi:transcriptional regulator with XRE-family HTH domain
MFRMEPFKALVNQRLDAIGWSQRELARRTGLSTSTLNRYLTKDGTPGLQDAAKIAREVGISLDALAGLPSEIPTQEEREILRVVRTVGPQESLRRLVQAPVYAIPAQPPNHNRGAG